MLFGSLQRKIVDLCPRLYYGSIYYFLIKCKYNFMFFCINSFYRMICHYSIKRAFKESSLLKFYVSHFYLSETVLSWIGKCFMKKKSLKNSGLNELIQVFTVWYFLVFDMPIYLVILQWKIWYIAFLTLSTHRVLFMLCNILWNPPEKLLHNT